MTSEQRASRNAKARERYRQKKENETIALGGSSISKQNKGYQENENIQVFLIQDATCVVDSEQERLANVQEPDTDSPHCDNNSLMTLTKTVLPHNEEVEAEGSHVQQLAAKRNERRRKRYREMTTEQPEILNAKARERYRMKKQTIEAVPVNLSVPGEEVQSGRSNTIRSSSSLKEGHLQPLGSNAVMEENALLINTNVHKQSSIFDNLGMSCFAVYMIVVIVVINLRFTVHKRR